jgi:hypothetical protein
VVVDKGEDWFVETAGKTEGAPSLEISLSLLDPDDTIFEPSAILSILLIIYFKSLHWN